MIHFNNLLLYTFYHGAFLLLLKTALSGRFHDAPEIFCFNRSMHPFSHFQTSGKMISARQCAIGLILWKTLLNPWKNIVISGKSGVVENGAIFFAAFHRMFTKLKLKVPGTALIPLHRP